VPTQKLIGRKRQLPLSLHVDFASKEKFRRNFIHEMLDTLTFQPHFLVENDLYIALIEIDSFSKVESFATVKT
jgi:hypothetical protein